MEFATLQLALILLDTYSVVHLLLGKSSLVVALELGWKRLTLVTTFSLPLLTTR